LPGAREWLTSLHAAGWKQAIVTSAPSKNATVMLRALGLGQVFEAIVTADDVVHGKPDPEVFLHVTLSADVVAVALTELAPDTFDRLIG
jgi:HAD superfamily hydrolase (TIGR01549 family)